MGSSRGSLERAMAERQFVKLELNDVLKYPLSIVLSTLLCTGLLNASEQKPESHSGFQALLDEARVVVSIPEGFASTERFGFCDQAFESVKQDMVMCLMLRPLSRMEIDYDDPHSSAPNPNQVFPLLFESMLNQLSDYSDQTIQAFEQEYALQHFYADWAQAASFSLKETIGLPHKDALLIALHKDHIADAYLLVSYEAPELAKKTLVSDAPVLRFSED